MLYDEFSYLWPPRPEQALDRTLLTTMEKRGFVTQVKKNGTCNVIFVAPDKTITTMSRHNAPHKQWTATPEVMKAFSSLGGSGWYVFVAELLHNKVAGLREVNYVHDILVNDGDYLVGRTQAERQEILRGLFLRGGETETYSHVIVNDNVWLPIEYRSGFLSLFNSLSRDEDEGIVMKDPRSKLALCSKQKSNIANLYKCRKPHKNFSF